MQNHCYKSQVMLDAVIQYVEAVLDGTEEPDNSVGRALNDMVGLITP